MERRFADLVFKLALGAAFSIGAPAMAQTVLATAPAIGAPAVRTAVPPPDPAGTLTFTAENDLFGGNKC